MVSFPSKNPNLCKFWRASDGKRLIYFRALWNILRIFGIFYDHWVHFVFIWYNFSGFGIMYPEKSGNPTCEYHQCLVNLNLVWTESQASKEVASKIFRLHVYLPYSIFVASD
jgi:hypothetical protein